MTYKNHSGHSVSFRFLSFFLSFAYFIVSFRLSFFFLSLVLSFFLSFFIFFLSFFLFQECKKACNNKCNLVILSNSCCVPYTLPRKWWLRYQRNQFLHSQQKQIKINNSVQVSYCFKISISYSNYRGEKAGMKKHFKVGNVAWTCQIQKF